jgi:hypothetical protein
MDVVPGFPGIVFYAEVLPFHQVPKFPVDKLAVQNFFYYPFFLSIDDFRQWRRREMPSDNWVCRGRCKLDYVKDGVKAFHRWG